MNTKKSTHKQTIKNKILVVEDDKLCQIAIKAIINQNGYACDIAETGAEALKLVKAHRYQLIFMDIGLPDSTGFEVTDKIRADGNDLISLPIIALTAHTADNVKHECSKAGMNEIISKPLAGDVFRELVSKYIQGAAHNTF